MKPKHWKWLLPVLQVTIALTCFVYGPHEYVVKARARGVVNNSWYFFQNKPTPVERLSLAINYPALVASKPFEGVGPSLYEYNGNYGYIEVTLDEVVFFCAMGGFWYVVGLMIDKRLGNVPHNPGSSSSVLARVAVGLVLGVLCAVNGIHMIRLGWRPYWQIGVFGVLWSVVLVTYHLRMLVNHFRNPDRLGCPLP